MSAISCKSFAKRKLKWKLREVQVDFTSWGQVPQIDWKIHILKKPKHWIHRIYPATCVAYMIGCLHFPPALAGFSALKPVQAGVSWHTVIGPKKSTFAQSLFMIHFCLDVFFLPQTAYQMVYSFCCASIFPRIFSNRNFRQIQVPDE